MEPTVLERIQSYVRRYASEHRLVERSGPFLATFGRRSNGPYLNYAVPDDHSEPTVEDVVRLAATYKRHDLRPRVELVPDLAPAAVVTLCRAGFEHEGLLPLMTLNARSVVEVARPDGIEIVFADDPAEFTALVEVRHTAFGESRSSATADAAHARATAECGGLAALAMDSTSGEAIASGACLIPYEGVTELTSVGVLAAYRRRGIGAHLTATLAAAAIMTGVEIVYLTPAHDEGERLYERVGFKKAGESLHLGL